MTPTVLAFAAASALGWSLCDLSRRFLAARMTAWALVFWVTVGALPLLALWALVRGEGGFEPAGYLLPGLASLALNVGANFAFFRALQLSPLSVTLPVLSLTPVFSALLGSLFLDEQLPARALAGVAMVVVGAFLLAARLPHRPSGGRRMQIESGSLVMAGVALGWSATMLLDKLALEHIGAIPHALVLHTGVATVAAIALGRSGLRATLPQVRRYGPALVATIVFGAVALGSQLLAIRELPIGFVETLKRGVGGALAVVWGRAFFDEPVTATKLVAIGLLGGGVALLTL